MMKKIVLLVAFFTFSIGAWSFNQQVKFEEETHRAVKEFGDSVERSSKILAESVNNISEKGIASFPWQIHHDVWKELRQTLYCLAFLLLGLFFTLFGVQLLIYHLKKEVVTTTYRAAFTSFCMSMLIIFGPLLMILSNIIARCIVAVI